MEKKYEGIVNYSKENNELTKKSLKEALIKLMRDYDFDNISISKLCNVAGVSRMSFYRNYEIMNDLLKEIAMDFNIDIINNVGSPFRDGTDLNWYLKTFEKIQKNKESYTIFFQKKFQEEWMKSVNYLANKDAEEFREKYYERLMWCGGFEMVASNWVSNGMKESIDEISKYCVMYLPNLKKN